jgi:predicted small metal-binding protein
MKRVVRCRDAGIRCDFEACGQSEKEILGLCVVHVRSVHTDANPLELAKRIIAASREQHKVTVRCDVVLGCEFNAYSQIADEVLAECAEHMRCVHGIKDVPFELTTRILSAFPRENEAA